MRGAGMKARGNNLVHVFMSALLVCLLLLTCTAYAAPAAAPKSAQQVKPAGGTVSDLLNPNAPPKGTITLNASSKDNVNASIWITGSYQFIQWTCNGTRSNLVDVTLWQNNQQVVVIGTGIATGKTAYAVPSTMAAGSYELRVTSEDDTRIEAKLPVTVPPPSITVTAPKANEVLRRGTQYTITWTYTGDLGGTVRIDFRQLLQDGTYMHFGKWSVTQINMSAGQGSAIWSIPQDFAGNTTDPFYITVASRTNPPVSATSGGFRVDCEATSLTGCDGNCVNLQTDSANCGSCGNKCPSPSAPTCLNGKCVCSDILCPCIAGDPYCPAGVKAKCTNAVYLQVDKFNCGSCGNVCPGTLSCIKGSCGC